MTRADQRDYAVFEDISVTAQEILNCSYSNWSKYFSHNVPPARVISPLPQAFIDYLSSESIRLPQETLQDAIVADSDNEYSDWEEGEEDETDPVGQFSDLHQLISTNLMELGRKVMVKFNWSAPKDAKWILINNSMKCETVNDIYLILNASDHIAHDVDHAFEETDVLPAVDYELVMKQWIDINPALEFRVFVHNNRIIGISQRDLNFYDYLQNLLEKIQDVINKFWDQHQLGERSKFGNDNYIMDIYVPRPFNKVLVLDINPFSRKSDSLLFTWNELLQYPEAELRLINETNLGRFSQKDHSENQVPLEVIDASMNTESMVELMKNWKRLESGDSDEEAAEKETTSESETSESEATETEATRESDKTDRNRLNQTKWTERANKKKSK